MMLMPLLRTRDATASSRSTNGDSNASGSGESGDDDEEDDATAATDDTEEEDCIVPVGLAGSPFLSNTSSRQKLERALLQARCYAACADQFHTTNDVSHVSAWGHS